MKVLVACEESQMIANAYRSRGIEAWSCDLKPCSGGHPEYHIQGDCRVVLADLSFDLVIAHPPCTFLTRAGARWLYPGGVLDREGERYQKMLEAREFFLFFTRLPCRVAIENPVPMRVCGLPEPSQVIQPYYFGHPYKKTICLWLYRLPPLMPTIIDWNPTPASSSAWFNKGGKDRSSVRARTFPGIAAAIADQWRF